MFLRFLFLALFVINTYAFYSENEDIIVLTESNLKDEVLDSSDIWVIKFYAPWSGHCKALAPVFKSAAKALKGIAKFGAIDMTQNSSLPEVYHIPGYPEIKIFGHSKDDPLQYRGERTPEDLIKAVEKIFQEIFDTILKEKKYDESFYSREFENPKPEVVELTDDNFENTKYHAGGISTIKYFGVDKNGGVTVEYNGSRKTKEIVAWANSILDEQFSSLEIQPITSQSIFDKTCRGKEYCIIAVLPNINVCDVKCRIKHLKNLQNFAHKLKHKNWGWTWMEGGQQKTMENEYDIYNYYPAIIALSRDKQYYSKENSNYYKLFYDFLHELDIGKRKFSKIDRNKFPEIVNVEHWNYSDEIGESEFEEKVEL